MNTKTISRTLTVTSIAAAFAITAVASAAGGVEHVGNPYSPAGANFSIFAFQGLDANGMNGSDAQVNLNFEFNPSIGVTYNDDKGHLKDFGLGLYQNKGSDVASTGLMVQYDSLTNADSANLTVMDFDIKSLSSGFKAGKVAPAALIFGANGQLLATATPTDFLSTMVANASGEEDVWDVNIGKLLSSHNMSSNSAISKVLLFADATNGEKSKSDPYLLRSVANGQPVPEPASLAALSAGLLLLRRRKKA